jgi:hypothetical protein
MQMYQRLGTIFPISPFFLAIFEEQKQKQLHLRLELKQLPAIRTLAKNFVGLPVVVGRIFIVDLCPRLTAQV